MNLQDGWLFQSKFSWVAKVFTISTIAGSLAFFMYQGEWYRVGALVVVLAAVSCILCGLHAIGKHEVAFVSSGDVYRGRLEHGIHWVGFWNKVEHCPRRLFLKGNAEIMDASGNLISVPYFCSVWLWNSERAFYQFRGDKITRIIERTLFAYKRTIDLTFSNQQELQELRKTVAHELERAGWHLDELVFGDVSQRPAPRSPCIAASIG